LERSGGMFRGLWLDVDAPALPVMRVEVAPPRQLRIVQGDETVLFGWVDLHYYGVEHVRSLSFRSPVDPIAAGEARRRGSAGGSDETWYAGWCHAFADALAASGRAPLHAGSWTLRPARVVSERASLSPMRRERIPTVRPAILGHDEPLLGSGQSGFIDWWPSGPGAVLPLRPLSPPDAGRVKAYRKLVREATMPPVLVWWIGGLSCSVIIDGHDRFAAASAEGVAPPVVELSGVRDVQDGRADDPDPAATLEDVLLRLAAGGETSPRARAIGTRLALAQLRAEQRSRTLTWPVPGGAEEWLRDATTRAPAWIDQLREQIPAAAAPELRE
jgi:hypothetical protein